MSSNDKDRSNVSHSWLPEDRKGEYFQQGGLEARLEVCISSIRAHIERTRRGAVQKAHLDNVDRKEQGIMRVGESLARSNERGLGQALQRRPDDEMIARIDRLNTALNDGVASRGAGPRLTREMLSYYEEIERAAGQNLDAVCRLGVLNHNLKVYDGVATGMERMFGQMQSGHSRIAQQKLYCLSPDFRRIDSKPREEMSERAYYEDELTRIRQVLAMLVADRPAEVIKPRVLELTSVVFAHHENALGTGNKFFEKRPPSNMRGVDAFSAVDRLGFTLFKLQEIVRFSDNVIQPQRGILNPGVFQNVSGRREGTNNS